MLGSSSATRIECLEGLDIIHILAGARTFFHARAVSHSVAPSVWSKAHTPTDTPLSQWTGCVLLVNDQMTWWIQMWRCCRHSDGFLAPVPPILLGIAHKATTALVGGAVELTHGPSFGPAGWSSSERRDSSSIESTRSRGLGTRWLVTRSWGHY